MNTTSCIPKEPFIKLDENGQASILNYSLPQSTSYNATAFLNLQIPRDFLSLLKKMSFGKVCRKDP
jgi:hypothetical protein